MIIANVDYKDLVDIFKLYKENYEPMNNKFAHNFVYAVDNKIVGFVIYTLIYENLEIVDIFIDKENRRKNIGTKLLEKVFIGNENKKITLEVNINNIGAIEFYKKLGFEKVAIRKGYYNGVDGYLMMKK